MDQDGGSEDGSNTDYMVMCQMWEKKRTIQRQLLVLGPSSWVDQGTVDQCREGCLERDSRMKIKRFVLNNIKFEMSARRQIKDINQAVVLQRLGLQGEIWAEIYIYESQTCSYNLKKLKSLHPNTWAYMSWCPPQPHPRQQQSIDCVEGGAEKVNSRGKQGLGLGTIRGQLLKKRAMKLLILLRKKRGHEWSGEC